MDSVLQAISTLDLRNTAIVEHKIYKDIVIMLCREARTFWRNQEAVYAAIERNNLMWILQEN